MPKPCHRDDFASLVKRELRERAGNTCCRCGVSTLAPKTGPRGVLILGIAAHIHAASPGGPRAAPHLSAEERSGYENGIWLCTGCATLIDREPLHYPAATLVAMKLHREAEARRTQGRRPGEDEGRDQMIAALSGYPTLHTAPPLIANAHRATELALHRLDPRIEIRTCHAHGRTTMTLQAREPVSFTLMAPLAQQDEWQQAMSALAAMAAAP